MIKSFKHLQLRWRLVLRIRRRVPTRVFRKVKWQLERNKNLREGSWERTGGTPKWDRFKVGTSWSTWDRWDWDKGVFRLGRTGWDWDMGVFRFCGTGWDWDRGVFQLNHPLVPKWDYKAVKPDIMIQPVPEKIGEIMMDCSSWSLFLSGPVVSEGALCYEVSFIWCGINLFSWSWIDWNRTRVDTHMSCPWVCGVSPHDFSCWAVSC